MCWHCYWGVPKPVADIYHRAAKALDDVGYSEVLLQFGPGHIVWSDLNLDSGDWCLEHFDEYKDPDIPDAAWEIVRQSLRELVALDPAVRDIYPDDIDELMLVGYANYPPPDGVEMVKI